MGSPSLLCLKELLFLCLSLACFDSFARFFIFVIFVIFVGRPFPSLCQAFVIFVFRFLNLLFSLDLLFSLYLWGSLRFSALKNCYFWVYRSLDLMVLLEFLFLLFSLYLWDSLPFYVLKICYWCFSCLLICYFR